MNTIDLHMHSLYSDDGEFTPAELVEKCRRQGINIMAIADHNTVRAAGEAARAAETAGITCIPAVEIDCTFQGVHLHVLGYGIDAGSPDFEAIEANITRHAAAASRKMLVATRALGFDIAEGEMAALSDKMFWKDRWTGEMFAEVLLGRPEYRDHPLLRPYRPGGARGDNPYVNFYWDLYSQGKPCHAAIPFPSLGHVIGIIHRSGGKAVLAHPGASLRGKDASILEGAIACGLDALEAFSSYHTPDEARRYYDRARARSLFATCGSDYHGKTKPAISPGGHGCFLSDNELEQELSALLR